MIGGSDEEVNPLKLISSSTLKDKKGGVAVEAKTLKKCAKPTKAERREELIAYMFLLPNMIGFIIFTLIPVIWGLLLSFTSYDGFGDVKFIALANFKKLFSDGYFITSLKNNIF